MKRKYAPAEGTPDREGWDKCLDLPPERRRAAMASVVQEDGVSLGIGWAAGWMDAWDTFGEDSWEDIRWRLGDGKNAIKQRR